MSSEKEVTAEEKTKMKKITKKEITNIINTIKNEGKLHFQSGDRNNSIFDKIEDLYIEYKNPEMYAGMTQKEIVNAIYDDLN